MDRRQAVEKYRLLRLLLLLLHLLLLLLLLLRSLSMTEEREMAGARAVQCVPRFPRILLPVVPRLEGVFGDRVLAGDEGVGASRKGAVYGSWLSIVSGVVKGVGRGGVRGGVSSDWS